MFSTNYRDSNYLTRGLNRYSEMTRDSQVNNGITRLCQPPLLSRISSNSPKRNYRTMPTVTKSTLITMLAERTDVTKKAASESIESVFETIIDTVKQGNSVTLAGIGTFKLKQSAARTGRNPRTGESIEIAAKSSIVFKSAPSLEI